MNNTIDNTDCKLLNDSGSENTIVNLSIVKHKKLNCIQTQWSENELLELKSFSNDIVETLGTLKPSVKFNDWQIPGQQSLL